MLKIKRRALLSALEAAKNVYPDEFVGLFRGDGELAEELIIPPFSTYERDSSGFSDWFLPANNRELASFHSHPSPGTAFPSKADRLFFAKTAKYHFIACPPFGEKNVNAFDSKGKQITFGIVR